MLKREKMFDCYEWFIENYRERIAFHIAGYNYLLNCTSLEEMVVCVVDGVELGNVGKVLLVKDFNKFMTLITDDLVKNIDLYVAYIEGTGYSNNEEVCNNIKKHVNNNN